MNPVGNQNMLKYRVVFETNIAAQSSIVKLKEIGF